MMQRLCHLVELIQILISVLCSATEFAGGQIRGTVGGGEEPGQHL